MANMLTRVNDALVIEDFYDYVDLYNTYKSNPSKFNEQIKEFESRLKSKYGNFSIYNTNEMSDYQIAEFASEVCRDLKIKE